MKKEKTQNEIDTAKDIIKLWTNIHSSSHQGIHKEGNFISFIFGVMIISCLIYWGVSSDSKPTPTITTKDIIKQEETLRSIVFNKKENNEYNTKVELYQTQLNSIQTELESLKNQKQELLSELEKKKELLKKDMLLKNEIKEIELSQANGAGWQEGYEKGLIDGRNQNSGSGFGAGLLMGHLFSK